LYDESNFSATALANREKTRNQDLHLMQDEYDDLKENIKYLEKTPEELRNKEWWDYYLE
jgi:hypothetical protein